MMTESDPKVADEVPWSDDITEYDNQHDETYLGLLDVDEKQAPAATRWPGRSLASTLPGSRSAPARQSTAIWHAPAG